jgi:hypothetical protein
MPKLLLSGSIGKGYENNEQDVKAVRQRLRTLGFHWVRPDGPGDGEDLVKAIKLFQAIFNGRTKLTEGKGLVDGKITRLKTTHQWLAASNAPGWVMIYGKQGPGWYSTVDKENPPTGDPYVKAIGGYGTTWILNVIKYVASTYSMCRLPNYPDMWLRDCAKEKGGK